MSDDGPGEIKRVGGKLVYSGPVASVRMDRFEYPDGSSTLRQVVVHPGSVVIAAHDEKVVFMVRQPREPVGEPDLLELPAGKRDVEGESALECAQRELVEEVGRSAGDWRELKSFYTSPGIITEECTLFLATELYEVEADPQPGERIEIVEWPLDDLDGAIAECADAVSIIGLQMLRELR